LNLDIAKLDSLEEELRGQLVDFTPTAFTAVTPDIIKGLGITVQNDGTLNITEPLGYTQKDPSEHLVYFLNILDHKWGRSSEASFRTIIDFFIADVAVDRNFVVWLEVTINTGALTGRIDYLLSKKKENVLNYDLKTATGPYLIAVEAKHPNTFESALDQMIAELWACANCNPGTPLKVVYGILTTGNKWQFFKLDNNVITKTHTIERSSNNGNGTTIIYNMLRRLMLTVFTD